VRPGRAGSASRTSPTCVWLPSRFPAAVPGAAVVGRNWTRLNKMVSVLPACLFLETILFTDLEIGVRTFRARPVLPPGRSGSIAPLFGEFGRCSGAGKSKVSTPLAVFPAELMPQLGNLGGLVGHLDCTATRPTKLRWPNGPLSCRNSARISPTCQQFCVA
jgi:hypothetical protein